MLLFALFDPFLDKLECSIDDLLVKLKLSLLLLQLFLVSLDLHWIEVLHLVLVCQELVLTGQLVPLLSDLVLLSPSFTDLLIVEDANVFGLRFHDGDLLTQIIQLLDRFILYLLCLLLDINLFLLLLLNE